MIGSWLFQGSLFAEDFLRGSISELPKWKQASDADLDGLETELKNLFDRFPAAGTPNESQTEADLIWPILSALRWTASLRQQNLVTDRASKIPNAVGAPHPNKTFSGKLGVIQSILCVGQ